MNESEKKKHKKDPIIHGFNPHSLSSIVQAQKLREYLSKDKVLEKPQKKKMAKTRFIRDRDG